ncbi:MAG: NAD(P)H-hydrate dehydratase [Actinomycetia bacterium]|nr:NAD(P)H-hydrate dehydratase [Actinomycetes bacterium]MCP4963194.1 NAD(P)H-hydrate dehydratase [Actinomycetes bacterium]
MTLRHWRPGGPWPTPVLTPEQVHLVDDAAPDIASLIERAGRAVARVAIEVLGGTYGRRVVVVAGPGNNGADGLVAARRLAERGVRVEVVDPEVSSIGECDLVIDAAFGTGLSRRYEAPLLVADQRVLAVDVPSGLDATVGTDLGSNAAGVTVTFGGPKVGMFLGDGPSVCGDVVVVDIGLDLGPAAVRTWMVDDEVARTVLPRRQRSDHKWNSAVRVVAGSAGMWGAARLTAGSAIRAGAGMVVAGGLVPEVPPGLPVEVVGRGTAGDRPEDRVASVLSDLHRFGSLVVGPGLGAGGQTAAAVASLIVESPVPCVVDADGLRFLAGRPEVIAGAVSPIVITPHDGEYAQLVGFAPERDRVDAARRLAATTQATVLLKGPTTVVASPEGDVWLSTEGDERLATAGSGDVLAGAIGAVLACHRGSDIDDMARLIAATAHWHAIAGRVAGRLGVVAGDIVGSMGAARAIIEG